MKQKRTKTSNQQFCLLVETDSTISGPISSELSNRDYEPSEEVADVWKDWEVHKDSQVSK